MSFDTKMVIALIALCAYILFSVIVGLSHRFSHIGLLMLLAAEFATIVFLFVAIAKGVME